MAAFLIDADIRKQLFDAVAWARANPIPWEKLKEHVPNVQREHELLLADRGDDVNWRPPSREVMIPFGWRLAISCERQPAGLLLHVSMSSPTPTKTVPRPETIEMLANALADMGVLPKDRGDWVGNSWIEEFLVDDRPGGKAINVVWLLEKA